MGDLTTVFYNPFRNFWVDNLRSGTPEVGRCRAYVESADVAPLAGKPVRFRFHLRNDAL